MTRRWQVTETSPEDEAVVLRKAAEELRRRMKADGPVAFNVEYVMFAVARLLEELSRSVAAGHPLQRHVSDAALEIAHHIAHRDQAGHPLREST